eukprot:7378910-Prymnesium_polylepis.2
MCRLEQRAWRATSMRPFCGLIQRALEASEAMGLWIRSRALVDFRFEFRFESWLGKKWWGKKSLAHGEYLLGEPILVGVVDELVGEDAHALVLPQREQREARLERLLDVDREDALEDAREGAQVEQVVELGGRRQHLGLDPLPDADRHRDERARELDDLRHLGPTELGLGHGAEDLVDGGDRRQRHVHHVEVPLGAVGDVVLATARVEHRREEDQVDDKLPLARLVEIVEADTLDELAHQLQRDLVAPIVDERHREVVDEDKHLLATCDTCPNDREPWREGVTRARFECE